VGRSALILLDTHVWLWWVAAPEKLSRRAHDEIERTTSIGVSSISCWEVGMLAARKRISLDREVPVWTTMALQRDRVVTLDVTPEIASEAALLDRAFPSDPVDRLLYATARHYRARLLTRDRELRKADPAATVW
jgi:PIN domain nuclease of toxin-antitoxin system